MYLKVGAGKLLKIIVSVLICAHNGPFYVNIRGPGCVICCICFCTMIFFIN